MHYPFVKQLDQAGFRETFGAAFGKEAVIFENLCLSQEMGQLKFEEVLRLIENNTFMEVHPRAWLKSFEALSPSIRLARDGRLIDQRDYQKEGFDEFGVRVSRFSVEHIRSLVEDGATLIFNSIDKAIPKLGNAVADIRGALGALCSLNAYYTPANNFGFGAHWDDHDVIIFQIEGSKEWRVLGNPTPEPHQSVPKIAGDPPRMEDFRVVNLLEGQALYIPRGWWHAASATSVDSLHLTLGIHLPTVAEKLSSLLLSSHKHPQLRMRVISKELEALGVQRADFWEALVLPTLDCLKEDI